MATDYYAVLGVPKDAGQDDIKKAYRKLARELHPDINPAEVDRMKEVTEAYSVLSDPEKRQRYDLGGSDMFGGMGGFGGAGFGGLGDIMDAFFGGGGPGAGGGRATRSRVRHGADVLVRLELDLPETAFGANKDVSYDTAIVCDECSGAGTARGTHPETCTTCRGRGEVSQVQRSFLGQVMTSRPCPACSGVGTTITHPCGRCQGDGRLAERRTVTELRSSEPWYDEAFAAFRRIWSEKGTADDWSAITPFFHGRWDATAQAVHARAQAQRNADAAALYYDEAIDAGTVRAALSRLQAPVLLVAGEYDVALPPSRAVRPGRTSSRSSRPARPHPARGSRGSAARHRRNRARDRPRPRRGGSRGAGRARRAPAAARARG